MINKPCALHINDKTYYVPEDIVLTIPYIQGMYSDGFKGIKDVDELTMREYIVNFDMFIDVSDFFCRILTDITKMKNRLRTHLKRITTAEKSIQLYRFLDFLNIDIDIDTKIDTDDFFIYFKIYEVNVKIEIGRSPRDISKYNLNLTHQEKFIYLKFLHLFQEKTGDKYFSTSCKESRNKDIFLNGINLVFPGSRDRYNRLKDFLRKYRSNLSSFVFYDKTFYWIFTGIDIDENCEISDEIPKILYIKVEYFGDIYYKISKFNLPIPVKMRAIGKDYREKVIYYYEDVILSFSKNICSEFMFPNIVKLETFYKLLSDELYFDLDDYIFRSFDYEKQQDVNYPRTILTNSMFFIPDNVEDFKIFKHDDLFYIDTKY